MAGSDQALFDRRCRLTIADPVKEKNNFKFETFNVTEIDGGRSDANLIGMRVQFDIKKTLKKEPNTSTITVTNLSADSRSKFQAKGVHVTLEAGYKDTGMVRYFAGDVRTVDHVRKGPDWESVFRLGDGERAWQFARVNESFAPGAAVSDVLRSVAGRMGIDLGNAIEQANKLGTKLDQGFCVSGSASRALDLLMKSIGMEWSIQDGALQILKVSQVLDLPVPEIGPDSGLLDSPEMGSPPKKGAPALVKFKCLLTSVKPGAKVKLKSERYNGYLRVVACSFKGDTSGGDWFSEISGELLK